MNALRSSSHRSGGNELVGVFVLLLAPSRPVDQQRYDGLQLLRRQHDDAFPRWLPHITLIPPFILTSSNPSPTPSGGDPLSDLTAIHAATLGQLQSVATQACAQHTAHELLLDQVATFPLRNYCNVHLRPAPTNFTDPRRPRISACTATAGDTSSRRIVQLQADLKQAVTPLVGRTGRREREVWKPHASVGQATGARAVGHLCRAAEALLHTPDTSHEAGATAGLLCDVRHVQLMLKPKGGPGAYHVHAQFPLALPQSE